jgi:uncharacterized membrane protein YbhN (UPF0104 family)
VSRLEKPVIVPPGADARSARVVGERPSLGRHPRRGGTQNAVRRGREPAERPRLRLPAVGRRMATLGLLGLLAGTLLAEVPALRGVPHQIRHIAPVWIAVAIALELASDVSFVLVFRLFFDRLEARDARLLAWTEQGSGVLLPRGGAGGLAIGAWLIRLTGAPLPWTVRRSAGLFFLGAAASGAALVGAGVALLAGAPGPHDFPRVVLPTGLAAAGILLIGALPAILHSRPDAPRWLRAIAEGVQEAERTTFRRRASWRLLGAAGYLGFDVAVLWVVLGALGHASSIAVVVLAYSIGYAANSLPVPGGIGVLDAGLTGALVLYGVAPVQAAAAVIVYHAIAFWIPGLGGLLAYLRLRPRLLQPVALTPAPTRISPQNQVSKEAHDARTRRNPQTDPPRLGGGPDRRPRTRPVHGRRS